MRSGLPICIRLIVIYFAMGLKWADIEMAVASNCATFGRIYVVCRLFGLCTFLLTNLGQKYSFETYFLLYTGFAPHSKPEVLTSPALSFVLLILLVFSSRFFLLLDVRLHEREV